MTTFERMTELCRRYLRGESKWGETPAAVTSNCALVYDVDLQTAVDAYLEAERLELESDEGEVYGSV